MAFWTKLAEKINRPDLKNVEYRESHSTVFADDKLWFFGLRSVSPTSMNFHETVLPGSFVSIYDLKTKIWSYKSFDKLDDDENHREHIFSVSGKIFMYVYSTAEKSYQKLFTWKDDKWSEVKLDPARCGAIKLPSCLHLVDTNNGFFALYEADGFGHATKMEISVENGEAKDVKQTTVAEVPLSEIQGMGVHLTGLAYNEDKVFVWWGQQGCGFRWEPDQPLYADLKSQPALVHLKAKKLDGAHPPFAFGGPSNTVMHKNQWIMLGGSRQCGLSQCEDVHEIWVFDVNSQKFIKTDANTPVDIPGWRVSTAFDRSTGNVYFCDLEKGIHVANLNHLK